MTNRLVIVQNCPTQFDEPLYAYMHRSGDFDLSVIYTQTGSKSSELFDHEIGRAPDWDHVESNAYDARYLTIDDAGRAKTIAKDIQAMMPNLVLLCGYYPPLHAKLARLLKKQGVRIGLRSDNSLEHSDFSGLKGMIKRLILPHWLRRYDSWHPVGSLARDYLEQVSGSKKPTYLFPYSVDVEWFARNSEEARKQRSELRKKLGLSDSNFVILGILKWHQREDPLTLIRAFGQLYQSYPQARLVLIGDGPLRNEVTSLVDPMKDAIVLPGYQSYSALPRFYAISDVFVHPAVDEPWGVSVQEALACKVPVVVAEGVGAKVELVEEGKTGFVFANGNHQSLTNILSEFLRSPEKMEQMQKYLSKRARKYDYPYTMTQFRAALEPIGK